MLSGKLDFSLCGATPWGTHPGDENHGVIEDACGVYECNRDFSLIDDLVPASTLYIKA
jgi:hypothetical protein